MSLGIRLLAHFSKPTPAQDELITEIEEWLRNKYAGMRPRTRREVVDSTPALSCQLHPAAEEIEMSFVSPSEMVASANTTTAGPGYHVFVTSVLRDLAHEFHAQWERPADDDENCGDETGYFFTGDEKRLNDEMSWWLASLASSFFDGSLDSDSSEIALCMPMNPQFHGEQAALTALGPRDHEWLLRTSQNGHSGGDFFAWQAPGFNAEYHLRRALAQMWVDVRRRPPVNDSESATLEDVADSLHRAFEMDPSLHYPWAEWKQILDLLKRSGADAELTNSDSDGAPTIGYRRREVTVSLPGGWRMDVPGSFGDFETDDEGDLSAVDPPREIWFTVFQSDRTSSPGGFESVKNERKKTLTDYQIERDGYFAQATIRKKSRETGEEYFVLNASNLAMGTRAVCTILYPTPYQRDWAVEVWRSIQPPPTSEL